ncbi:MAG TPA: 50S ribosomal protein L21e [Candidatus Thermoplasmatota archaeon]|nr:50S ribosomal protein L21e [Candidatus Thermoplasmatota archaeon]
MVVRSKGQRSKSRHKMTKPHRERGMPPITHTLRTYDEGTSVTIKINPSVHKGTPHVRFQGFTGRVIERRGDAYVVAIRVGGKMKSIIARPEHLWEVPVSATAKKE